VLKTAETSATEGESECGAGQCKSRDRRFERTRRLSLTLTMLACVGDEGREVLVDREMGEGRKQERFCRRNTTGAVCGLRGRPVSRSSRPFRTSERRRVFR
jgi:hypothetical protein